MFTRLFVQNPIFTNVIAIIAVILGIVSLTRLPIALYPDITPPTIAVSASYPGADAETVAKTVGAPIELQVNGVENMIYMSSTSADDGTYSLTVTFALGTDVNIAMVLLQNLVNNALPLLPQVVQQQGVTVTKHSPSILQVIALDSPRRLLRQPFSGQLRKPANRKRPFPREGGRQVQAFGAGFYAMRIWLDLDKLNYLGVSVDEVNQAISQQNVQVAAGNVGGRPNSDKQAMQLTVLMQGQLDTPTAFGDIIVKTLPGNQIIRLRDVGEIEMGAQSYGAQSQIRGDNAALIAIYQLPDANALETAANIRSAMEKLSKDFPTRHALDNAVRHVALRFHRRDASISDLCEVHCAGHAGRAGLPPELPGGGRPGGGHSRDPHGGVRFPEHRRFFGEHDIAFRARAGDRAHRGRLDHRCGSHHVPVWSGG
mgnify:CR=1 FL=1